MNEPIAAVHTHSDDNGNVQSHEAYVETGQTDHYMGGSTPDDDLGWATQWMEIAFLTCTQGNPFDPGE